MLLDTSPARDSSMIICSLLALIRTDLAWSRCTMSEHSEATSSVMDPIPDYKPPIKSKNYSGRRGRNLDALDQKTSPSRKTSPSKKV